jgi:hypothetical protein
MHYKIMTRKDYKAIASCFYRQIGICDERNYDKSQLEMLAHELAIEFEQENPQFDRKKFLEACGL